MKKNPVGEAVKSFNVTTAEEQRAYNEAKRDAGRAYHEARGAAVDEARRTHGWNIQLDCICNPEAYEAYRHACDVAWKAYMAATEKDRRAFVSAVSSEGNPGAESKDLRWVEVVLPKEES